MWDEEGFVAACGDNGRNKAPRLGKLRARDWKPGLPDGAGRQCRSQEPTVNVGGSGGTIRADGGCVVSVGLRAVLALIQAEGGWGRHNERAGWVARPAEAGAQRGRGGPGWDRAGTSEPVSGRSQAPSSRGLALLSCFPSPLYTCSLESFSKGEIFLKMLGSFPQLTSTTSLVLI